MLYRLPPTIDSLPHLTALVDGKSKTYRINRVPSEAEPAHCLHDISCYRWMSSVVSSTAMEDSPDVLANGTQPRLL